MDPVLCLHPRQSGAVGRRAFDLVVALTGFVVLVPALLVIACAIKLDTAGPVLFSHLRVGRAGRPFRLYKFRKFAHNVAGGGSLTLKHDARMTRVGRFLEQVKLDELPQLWNVFVGEMSIVGPRPETLDFADCFTGPYAAVLEHKPGLFGPSQVLFRSENSLYPRDQAPQAFYRAVLFPTKARIDLAYFPRRTLIADIGWVVRGALALCGVSGARACRGSDIRASEFLPDSLPSAVTAGEAAEHSWHAR
jgi:lipopolysaccharide/colanic/teichoic acid biosynthesis glycosyltransferase